MYLNTKLNKKWVDLSSTISMLTRSYFWTLSMSINFFLVFRKNKVGKIYVKYITPYISPFPPSSNVVDSSRISRWKIFIYRYFSAYQPSHNYMKWVKIFSRKQNEIKPKIFNFFSLIQPSIKTPFCFAHKGCSCQSCLFSTIWWPWSAFF